MTSWVMLQLADSAFPIGGFAHSSGLEAFVQSGQIASVADLETFAGESIAQTMHGSLPLVSAVFDDASATNLRRVDRVAHSALWNHVAARASRAQGRALLDTAARSFGRGPFEVARAMMVRGEIDGHFAPVFGLVTSALDAERDDALAAFLHLALRSVLSAAVRLGVVGPFEAQAIQHRQRGALAAALATGRRLELDDVAQTAPLIDILQGTQDRLYSRLFQS